MTDASTLRLAWRRGGGAEVDEHCTVDRRTAGVGLTGTVLGAEDGIPVRVEYSVRTDLDGFTTEVHVLDVRGFQRRAVALTRDVQGNWTVDGDPAPALQGCTDVDLGCSPSTNALPIRRLSLAAGESSTVQVAWLRFPQLTVARMDQSYARLDADRYRYASGGFAAELTVDEDGFVVEYDEWHRTALGSRRGHPPGLAWRGRPTRVGRPAVDAGYLQGRPKRR